MHKKDMGLAVLIIVVGAVVYLRNPLFLSPINLGNTANLIGLFGLFAIGQGFVIMTGGIDLAVGSMIALLGVLFVDMVGKFGVPWPLAILITLGLGAAMIGLGEAEQQRMDGIEQIAGGIGVAGKAGVVAVVEQHGIDGLVGPGHGDAELGIGAARQPVKAIHRLQQALLFRGRPPKS